MLRGIFLAFGAGVILLYLTSSWFGWELAGSGRNSMFRAPFVGGFRGGK